MTPQGSYGYTTAVQDFRRARRQAAIQEVLARLGGKSLRLLAFEEVRTHLAEQTPLPRGLKEIPLDAIVGSVGRYADFNRQFLPKLESQLGRWARVRIATEDKGLPPIEVYQLGKVYFVLDGNHRVSVARQLGAKSIEAHVTEISLEVPLAPEDEADQIILKVEQARFMEDSQLAQLQPQVELKLTVPGSYRELREHIAIHQYQMGIQQKEEIDWQLAAKNWVSEVYLPAIAAIRQRGLLRDFPERTEADLYMWLMKHRSELSQTLGWELDANEEAEDLGQRFSRRFSRIRARVLDYVRDKLTLAELERGPAAGAWRKQRTVSPAEDKLFARILVTVSGEARSWRALDQAILVAQREGGRLRGLHVSSDKTSENSEEIAALRSKFEARLKASAVSGTLVVEHGAVARNVERRARWSDLAVLHLLHPPGDKAAERVRSGLRTLIQRIPRPLLLVPRFSPMENALLAFDGSRKGH